METKRECPDELNGEFISYLRNTLVGWMIRDAKMAASNRAFIGALILGVCAIDVLGGLYSGLEKTDADKTFKPFIKEYLPNHSVYLDGGLYRNMRNFLVHGYSSQGFKYTDEYPAKHLQIDKKDGLLWIHVDTFLWEVETAAREYLNDLTNRDELWDKFKERWSHAPLLGPIDDKI